MSDKRLGALTAFFVLWSLLTIGVVGTTAWEYSKIGHYDEACPEGDSTVGSSHWQWWLPGRVCDYPNVVDQTDGAAVVVARVLVPIVWLVLLIVVMAAFRSYIHEHLREIGRDDEDRDDTRLDSRS